jgi:hypothetical protein
MVVYHSGPAFFKQLSLPPSVALPASWASQTPRNAALASKGLASQLGASLLFPLVEGGPAALLSASAPALSYALAPGDAAPVSTLAAPPAGGCVFLTLADRYMCLLTEKAGALLVVARVTKAPGKLSDPFIIVLGAPTVPWDVDQATP